METLVQLFQSNPLGFVDTAGTWLAILVGIIVSAIIYKKQRAKKALSYYTVASAPLLTVSKLIKSHIVVLYKGEPIENADITFIRFTNTGAYRAKYGESSTTSFICFTNWALSIALIGSTIQTI